MRWAIFLRAVNVGGTGKLPMAELRRALEAAGAQDVATYVQSGNVVLDHPAEDAARMAAWTGDTVEAAFGFRPGRLGSSANSDTPSAQEFMQQRYRPQWSRPKQCPVS